MQIFKNGDITIFDSTNPSIPKNNFISWFKDKLHQKAITFNFHYDDKEYLLDFIKDYIEKWTCDSPVFISTQTGTGKNYTIFNKFLPHLIKKYPDKKDLILILSNRTALNRQTKIEMPEYMILYKQDGSYKEKLDYYTGKGLDSEYIDFGVVTICNYQQLMKRKILDNKKFDMIIVDECHFFTSDATFNKDTEKILKEIVSKGQDSIRVYMSATPEVAFEAIIRAEFDNVESKKDDMITQMQLENSQYCIDRKNYLRGGAMVDFAMASARLNNSYLTNGYFYQTPETLSDQNTLQEITNLYHQESLGIAKYSSEDIKNACSQFKLNVHFYYMPRHYEYIESITFYSKNEELLQAIKNSNEKWIIFVHSEEEGRNLEELLNQDQEFSANNDCIFISRTEINKDDQKRKEYEYIIEHETTSKFVLITTSVLDNGINIKNEVNKKLEEKIINVAIDTLDKTQFLQMLGRVRNNKKDFIRFYIKKCSHTVLKRQTNSNAGNLLRRLNNDLLTTEEKKLFFEVNHDVLMPTFDDKICSYNSCAIYQIISQVSRSLRIIRMKDKDFFVNVGSDLNVTQEKVWTFCKKDSQSWSRSVFDLLDSKPHQKERQEVMIETLRNNENYPEDMAKYDFRNTLNETFETYLFGTLIPEYFLTKIKEKIQLYLDRLSDPKDKNYYKNLVNNSNINHRVNSISELTILLLDAVMLLKKLFPDTFVDISVNFIENYAKKISHYESLANDENFVTFEAEQLRWLEKFDDDPMVNKNSSYDKTENMQCKTLEEFIQAKAISEKKLEQNKMGKNSKYYKADFLNKYGIRKGSEEENNSSEKYFNGKLFNDLVKEKFQKSIGDKLYQLKSCNDNTNKHSTYYLFVEMTEKS